jgi:hypothetical protein
MDRKIKRICALVVLGMFVLMTMPGIVTATPWDHTGNTNGEDGYLGDTEPYNLIFITDNTPRMRITSGGNVGIGIVPDANVKLDIDTGSNTYGLRLRGTAENQEIADIYVRATGQLCFDTRRGSDIEGYFDFMGEDSHYGLLIRESSAASTSIWGNIYVKDGGTTGPSSDDFMTFDVNSGAQGTLTVTAGGNVGIGTMSPNRKLEVVSASTQLRLTRTSTIYTEFTVDSNHDLTITPSSTGQIKLRPTFDSADFFQVLDTDGGTPILNVDAIIERVGIGTAIPSAKLHVEGSTVITGSLNVDSATLYVDSTTNRVGIGTTSLGERLTISGNILFNWGQDRKI